MNDFNNLAPDPSVPGGEETCQTGSKTAQVCQRELDALVAEKVMGQSLVADTPQKIGRAVMACMGASSPRGYVQECCFFFDSGRIWEGQEYRLQTDGQSKFNYGGADGNGGYGLYFWDQRKGSFYEQAIEQHVARWRDKPSPYSTDIAAAWKVVEKMREQAWRLDIGSYYQDHHGWSACFDNYSTYFRSDAPHRTSRYLSRGTEGCGCGC
jgi:hypothetical protein